LSRKPIFVFLLLVCSSVGYSAVGPVAAQLPVASPLHPLDHLTPAEHWQVYDILRASGRAADDMVVAYVGLHEPPKAEVLGWSEGQPFRREASVHVIQENAGYEAVLDLRTGTVLSWSDSPGQNYMYTKADEETVSELMLAHPEVRAALARRGVTDFHTIECYSVNEGYFDQPEERGNRVMRAVCGEGSGRFTGYTRTFEGLVAVVDVTSKQVLRVMDDDVIPLAPDAGEFGADVIGPVREVKSPISVEQPLGPGYDVHGKQISWQNWRFHFRVDPRRGLVVSLVRWADNESERMIMYQGSVSELFVPYSSPQEPWSYQAYFDLGSYANFFGGVAGTLEPGADCPDYATYFDSIYTAESGKPMLRQRAVCLFERVTGDPAWRHRVDESHVESRVRRDLVLRMILTAGNYDYLFDYIFMQDGTIKIRVGASGMDQTRVTHAADATEARANAAQSGAPSEGLNGRYIAPHLLGVNHSHFFSMRLDLDVDGTSNSVAVDRIVTERLPEGNPRTSVWNFDTLIAQNEQDAQRHTTITEPEVWRFINPDTPGPYGDPVGYQIVGGHQAVTMLSPDDFIRRRAGFTEHTLWVTPFAADEMFAAGDYPTAHVPDQGLPTWTAANRSIANTDVVAWYTIGFHHIPRPEDWPMMPVEWFAFELRPVGFFESNPAMNIPRNR